MWHLQIFLAEVFQTRWYMAHFGQLSAKKHIGFSNAQSLLRAIASRAGYLSVADREKMTKTVIAKNSQNRSKFAKKSFTGVKKNLKQSQTLGRFNVQVHPTRLCQNHTSFNGIYFSGQV